MQNRKIIKLAAQHLHNAPESDKAWARTYLGNAQVALDKLALELARDFALKSLALSIGTSHPDYQRAAR